MRSGRIVDLRKKRPGAFMRQLPLRGAPKRQTLRGRRRRTRAIIALSAAALFGIAAYGASALSYLPQFSIERIDVSGAHDVRSSLIEAFVATKLWDGSPRFLSESNIFLYPRLEIERALQEFFPRIESATLSRASLLGNAITVSIVERNPFARWCVPEGSCYAMDSSGFVFAPASTTSSFETPYLFEGAFTDGSTPIGQTYLPGRFFGVLVLLERLGQSSFSPQKVSAEGGQDFSIALAEGFLLRVSYGTDVGSIVRNLELVLGSEALRGKESELEYIDLRFGNRVYYKVRGAQEVFQ